MVEETTESELEKAIRISSENPFVQGQKVVWSGDGRTYDFGYVGQTGKVIIYEEGECNLQDAHAVELKDLRVP